MVFCCGEIEVLSPEETVEPAKVGTKLSCGGSDSAPEENNLVSVIVPEGIAAGQVIAVMAPDGTRQVRATVPRGLKPGDSFLVRLATPAATNAIQAAADPSKPPKPLNQPNFASALDSWLTPSPDTVPAELKQKVDPSDNSVIEEAPVNSPVSPKNVESQVQRVSGSRVDGEIEKVNSPRRESTSPKREQPPSVRIPEQPPAQPPIPSPMQSPKHTQRTQQQQPHPVITPSSPSVQKLLVVHVPPGLPEGATMQVEVPGENRTLTAQVPPGVAIFHVAYTPRFEAHHTAPNPPARTPLASPPPQPPRSPVLPDPHKHKLLLVRVPEGTNAGTTLHVSVPDEPGRILAAQVPPGNVKEFHVSYEPRVHSQHQHQRRSTNHHHHHHPNGSSYPPPSPDQSQQYSSSPQYQQYGAKGGHFDYYGAPTPQTSHSSYHYGGHRHRSTAGSEYHTNEAPGRAW